jgi:hypothetical protein
MKRKMKIKHTDMTEQKFNQIKSLIDMNLKNVQIQEILKTSTGTICAVKRVPDFAAYKEAQRVYFANKKLAKGVSLVPVEKKASEKIDTPIYDVLVEIKELLTDTNRLIALSGKSKGFKLF